ncbi:MAG: twin-arginine translocase TatA/TatE family subunit [Gammaproteobacteria bacterium]|nr:twin-arginine translocase TatA/TatE family subunit [Gammaproteobacteria bacterium]
MGLGPLEIGLILAVVVLVFGGKKLRTLGSDLGQAIKGFRTSMSSETTEESEATASADTAEAKPKTAD